MFRKRVSDWLIVTGEYSPDSYAAKLKGKNLISLVQIQVIVVVFTGRLSFPDEALYLCIAAIKAFYMISSAFELEILNVDYSKCCRIWYNNFELVYILEGKGTHMINGREFDYDPKNFFVFVPGDCHAFIPDEETIYCSIRFTELFFTATSKNEVDRREWYTQLEQIFFNHNRLPGCILKDKDDRLVVRTLLEAIIKEYQKDNPNKMHVIRNLLFSVLTLAARNISIIKARDISIRPEEQRLVKLLHYIQTHIYERDKLTLDHLAGKFNMTGNYLSEYFKKRTGKNLKRYIQQYRLRLIKARLNFSEKTISEIAWEFNFTDLSHFNKVFKKAFGMSPSVYRDRVGRTSS